MLGPRHSIHVRRWAELARQIGCEVFVAGDVHPGTTPVELDGVAEEVFDMPHRPSVASITRAQSLMCRFWLRRLVRRLRPDLIHAHWLPTWGLWSASSGCHPLVVSAWGSDVYLLRGLHARNSLYALLHADRVTAPSRPSSARSCKEESPHKVAHVDLGVDLSVFRPRSDRSGAGPAAAGPPPRPRRAQLPRGTAKLQPSRDRAGICSVAAQAAAGPAAGRPRLGPARQRDESSPARPGPRGGHSCRR